MLAANRYGTLRTMAYSSLRSLTHCRRHLAVAVVLMSSTLAAPSFVFADIILDEFTDAAMAQGPLVDDDDFVETDDVGDLKARRQIRVAGGGTDVLGRFDVDVTSPGQMDVLFEEIIPTISGLPLTAVQFDYIFEPADVTEGGRNDAILFDFVELTGDIQPSFLRAWVFDDTNLRSSFFIALSPLVPNHSAHTLVAPFDEFTLRNGVPEVPDPTTLREIRFDFFFGGHTGELNWSARLERIRFGSSVVPEPSTILLLSIGIVVIWHRSWFLSKGVRRCAAQRSSQLAFQWGC